MRVAEKMEQDETTERELRTLSKGRRVEARLHPFRRMGDATVSSLGEPLASRFQIRNVNFRSTFMGPQLTPLQLQGPGVQVQASTTLALRPYSLNFLHQKNLSETISLGFSNRSAGSYGTKLILTR